MQIAGSEAGTGCGFAGLHRNPISVNTLCSLTPSMLVTFFKLETTFLFFV